MTQPSIKEVVVKLREAIQEAEHFGMVYTDRGDIITGAIVEGGQIVLTE